MTRGREKYSDFSIVRDDDVDVMPDVGNEKGWRMKHAREMETSKRSFSIRSTLITQIWEKTFFTFCAARGLKRTHRKVERSGWEREREGVWVRKWERPILRFDLVVLVAVSTGQPPRAAVGMWCAVMNFVLKGHSGHLNRVLLRLDRLQCDKELGVVIWQTHSCAMISETPAAALKRLQKVNATVRKIE